MGAVTPKEAILAAVAEGEGSCASCGHEVTYHDVLDGAVCHLMNCECKGFSAPWGALRVLTEALEGIGNGAEFCGCDDHNGPNCCSRVGEHCPLCWSAAALSEAARVLQGVPNAK